MSFCERRFRKCASSAFGPISVQFSFAVRATVPLISSYVQENVSVKISIFVHQQINLKQLMISIGFQNKYNPHFI